jgi:hypothetical protein
MLATLLYMRDFIVISTILGLMLTTALVVLTALLIQHLPPWWTSTRARIRDSWDMFWGVWRRSGVIWLVECYNAELRQLGPDDEIGREAIEWKLEQAWAVWEEMHRVRGKHRTAPAGLPDPSTSGEGLMLDRRY